LSDRRVSAPTDHPTRAAGTPARARTRPLHTGTGDAL